LNAVANPEYIESLRAVIGKLHGCDSKHVESVPVHEVFRGKTVWDGVVEVFDLVGHPKAKRAYGWSHPDGPDDTEERFVTVLELPPVVSPETAVKAAIVAEVKTRRIKP
jgi:hypothetical protein